MNRVIIAWSKSNYDLKTIEDSKFSLYLPFSRLSKAEYYLFTICYPSFPSNSLF